MAAYSLTLPGSYISPLVAPEAAPKNWNVRYLVPYTAITTSGASTSGDTLTITLGTTPTNWVVNGFQAEVATAFSGGTATVAATIGTTTVATAFASSFSLTTAGAVIPATGTNDVATPASATGVTSVSMTCVITFTGAGSVTSFTSGFLTIGMGIYDPTTTP